MLKLGHKPTVSTAHAYASPPPSPSMATHTQPIPPPLASTPSSGSTNPLDFPSLDVPYGWMSLYKALTTHPVVLSAISRIIAAAGQMSATVQTPFLSLCDASMGGGKLIFGTDIYTSSLTIITTSITFLLACAY